MISILDRTIAKHYLINVAVLLVALMSFVVAIDASLNFDEFAKQTERLLERAQGGEGGAASAEATAGGVRRVLLTLYLVFDFWWPNLIRLFNYMLGVVLVGAMGFTVTQMVRHRELVAIVASGQSLYRVARPILAVAGLLLGVQLATRELVMPRIAPLLARGHSDAGERRVLETSVPLTSDGQGRLWTADAFDAEEGTLRGVTIWERDEEGRGQRRIVAQAAAWRDGAWALDQGVIDRDQDPSNVNAPVDKIESSLDPTALTVRRFAGYGQSLSFIQLTRMLARPDLLQDASERRLDELDRLRFGRFGVMACNALTLIIALRFYLRKEPSNILKQSIRCAPVAIVSLLGGVLGANASLPGVPAALSVFVPALVLLPVAIAAATSVRT
ncbi:MAG: LptF/LptG family permease [Planctomycetota bacterium]|nr:LptF/LptG family permease [Planctomycetota bacterium]